jgi:hypothetical protein
MSIVPVFLCSFRRPGEAVKIRPVQIPESETVRSARLAGADSQAGQIQAILNNVFRFGQNDAQPLPFRSVSVGDVISLEGCLFIVENVGFRQIDRAEYQAIFNGRAS